MISIEIIIYKMNILLQVKLLGKAFANNRVPFDS